MGSRPAQAALQPGRIVTTLNSITHLSELGMVIDQSQSGDSALLGLTSAMRARGSGQSDMTIVTTRAKPVPLVQNRM